MTLTSRQLDEYKTVMREEIGDEALAQMTEQELHDSAIRLLELVQMILESHASDEKE